MKLSQFSLNKSETQYNLFFNSKQYNLPFIFKRISKYRFSWSFLIDNIAKLNKIFQSKLVLINRLAYQFGNLL